MAPALAREADEARQLRVREPAGLPEIGLRYPDLFEGRLQGGVVEEGHLHGALQGQLFPEKRRHAFLECGRLGSRPRPLGALPRPLGDDRLHVFEGRLRVHARAAGEEGERGPGETRADHGRASGAAAFLASADPQIGHFPGSRAVRSGCTGQE